MSPPVPSELVADDASILMVLIDTNPYLWSSTNQSFPFSNFLSHVLSFLNAVLLLNRLNQVVVIATGSNSCGYVFDTAGSVNPRAESLIPKLESFVENDSILQSGARHSQLSASLSMALCYIQRALRSGAGHRKPRILCLHGSPDNPGQYVALMNAVFAAQRSTVPIDSCVIGARHSGFLQQASYITGGVYLKPQMLCDGLLQNLVSLFATDVCSRKFMQLPKPVGVDFRASCFCHKDKIDIGFVCSVCLSVFCEHQERCSTCGSEFGRSGAEKR